MAGKTETGKPDRSDKDDKRSSKLEWGIAAASASVVVLLMGVIGYEAVTRSGGTPDIRVSKGSVYAMGHTYGMDVEVVNIGPAPVSGIEIEARFAGPDGETTSVVTIDYLGSGSEAEIGFGLPDAIAPDDVALRVVGYSYP